MSITSVVIGADLKPIVDFTLTDDDGAAVDRSDLDSDPRFMIAHIKVDAGTGRSKYASYIVSSVKGAKYEYEGATKDPALASANQAGADSGGTFTTISPGVYRYTFGKAINPADYAPADTTIVGAYVTRDSRAFVSNPLYDFVPVPDPASPAQTRDIAPTANCNGCHNPLAEHGGTRREVVLCQLCHTDQTVDPETGESLELSYMVHKIHRGEELSNLPYYIVGRNQSVADYSTVVFPQTLRHCTKCHQGGAESDYWKERPSQAACGSCHDDVLFDGSGDHAAAADTDCTGCHQDTQAEEFDKSVPGAHVVPYESSFNPGLALAITSVENMKPDTQPTVRFTIVDKTGAGVDLTTLDRVAMTFGGPTDDYTNFRTFTLQGRGAVGDLTTNAGGDYTFKPAGYKIPADATGTWSIGIEARTGPTPVPDVDPREEVEFGANNSVVHVDLTDGTLGGGAPKARRQVVDEAKCNSCHYDIIFHGNLRTDIEYCVICHDPWTTDQARRPGVNDTTNPPQSIDLQFLLHRIHTGEELENDFTVYGFAAPPAVGTPHNYNEILFPGDRRDCEKCHKAGTFVLPTPDGTVATLVGLKDAGNPDAPPTLVKTDTAIRTPATAACTGCHDADDAITHTRLNSITSGTTGADAEWSDACAVCHEEGREFAVSKLHQR